MLHPNTYPSNSPDPRVRLRLIAYRQAARTTLKILEQRLILSDPNNPNKTVDLFADVFRPYLAQVACTMVNVNGPANVEPRGDNDEFVLPGLLDSHIRKAFEHDRLLLLLYDKGSKSLTFAWTSTPFKITRRDSEESIGTFNIPSVFPQISFHFQM